MICTFKKGIGTLYLETWNSQRNTSYYLTMQYIDFYIQLWPQEVIVSW